VVSAQFATAARASVAWGRMRHVLLLLSMLAMTCCSRPSATPPPGPSRKTATLIVQNAAPSGGMVVVTATKEGLADLRLEVPVARAANQAGVAAAIHFLMPAPWQRASYLAGDGVVIPAIEDIAVDPGETGLRIALTVTPSPPRGYERD